MCQVRTGAGEQHRQAVPSGQRNHPHAVSSRRSMRNWMWPIIIVLIAALAAQIQSKRQRERCHDNMQTLATALEMYASGGPCHYPAAMGVLYKEHYLKQQLLCPSIGQDPYAASYRRTTEPDCFSFNCQFHRHCYDCERGLIQSR